MELYQCEEGRGGTGWSSASVRCGWSLRPSGAAVPVVADLADGAAMARKARARLDRVKWMRFKAVQSALAAGYSIRRVAEVARIVPSSAMRLGSEELPAGPPPA